MIQDKLYGYELAEIVEIVREFFQKYYECDRVVFDTWIGSYGFAKGYIVMRFKDDKPGYYTYSSWEFKDFENIMQKYYETT